MKNKTTWIIYLLFLFPFVSNGQSSQSLHTQSVPSQQQKRSAEATTISNGLGDTANLKKEVTVLGVFKYTFQSNKVLEPGKVDRWTLRIKQHFPQIIDLQLTSSTQLVEVSLNDTHSEQELLEIVQWFNYLKLLHN